jgi:PhnB protein
MSQKIAQLIPMLNFQIASEAIEFYKKAFGAVETMRMEDNGKIAHAEIKINDIDIMIADEYPDMDIRSPLTIGGCPLILLLVTDSVDEVFNKAISNGATIERAVTDQLGGQIRNGKLIDPFGYKWMISSRPKTT